MVSQRSDGRKDDFEPASSEEFGRGCGQFTSCVGRRWDHTQPRLKANPLQMSLWETGIVVSALTLPALSHEPGMVLSTLPETLHAQKRNSRSQELRFHSRKRASVSTRTPNAKLFPECALSPPLQLDADSADLNASLDFSVGLRPSVIEDVTLGHDKESRVRKKVGEYGKENGAGNSRFYSVLEANNRQALWTFRNGLLTPRRD